MLKSQIISRACILVRIADVLLIRKICDAIINSFICFQQHNNMNSPAKFYSITSGSNTPNNRTPAPSASPTPSTPSKPNPVVAPTAPNNNNNGTTNGAAKTKAEEDQKKKPVVEPLPEDSPEGSDADSAEETSEEESKSDSSRTKPKPRFNSRKFTNGHEENQDASSVELGRLHGICHELEAIVAQLNDSHRIKRDDAISMLYSLLDEAFTV